MCDEILVRKHGADDIYCETVGELSKALGKQPIEVSTVEDKDSCLCNARIADLGARQATDEEGNPWPTYIIEIST